MRESVYATVIEGERCRCSTRWWRSSAVCGEDGDDSGGGTY